MTRHLRRLDGVLRVRRAEEDLARLGLAAATAEVRHRDAALDDATERYRRHAGPSGACQGGELLAAHQAAGRLAAGVGVADRERSVAEAALAERRLQWSQAAQRVAALERLVERRRLEALADAQRRDDMTLDDLVTSRWVRAAGGGSQ